MWLLTLLVGVASATMPLDISPKDVQGVQNMFENDKPGQQPGVRYHPAPRLPESQAPSRSVYQGCQFNNHDTVKVHYHCIKALPHLSRVPANVTKL